MARSFAREGARMILHYRSGKKNVEKLCSEIVDGDALIERADLRREPEVRRLFAKAVARFGRVDTLVANAGAWEMRDVPLQRLSLAQWQATVDSVLTTTFLTVRGFFQLVTKQKRGNAVLIGSTAAIFGEAGHADYSAAKAGITYGLTRSLKNEIARIAPPAKDYCGGRVNCI